MKPDDTMVQINLGAHCCHMGAAVKHPVPDRITPRSFVIFDIWAL